MNHTLFIFSQSEADAPEGLGWWSNEHGWTNLVCATRFTLAERQTLNLPIARGNDARWATAREAYGCESQLERFIREVGDQIDVRGRQYTITEVKGDGDIVCAGLKSVRAEYTAIRCNNARVAGRPDAEVWSILSNGTRCREIGSFAVDNKRIKELS